MRQITKAYEIQQLELSILEYVAGICSEHGLQYFLAGGTLLGAVRHKGFIPWDNDMDISMPRQDYDRLIEIFEMRKDGRYGLLKIRNGNDYCYPFIKIVDRRTKLTELAIPSSVTGLGAYIDIFPIDGMPDDMEEAKRRIANAGRWASRIAWSVTRVNEPSMLGRCKHLFWRALFWAFGRERAFEKLNDIFRKTPFGSSSYVASSYGLRKEKEIIAYESFSDVVELEFEGRMFPAPIGYRQYLRQMYGDYMELPPEEERVPPHDIAVYLKEEGDR